MEVLSSGWRTDLEILALTGSRIEHRPTYVVVRSPDNPGYRRGNFVLLRRPPLRRDLGLVEDLFARELPGIEHRSFGIDAPDCRESELTAFADAGYTIEAAAVLTATDLLSPPRPNRTAPVRALATDDDWVQRFSLDIACRGGGAAGFSDLARLRTASERQLTTSGSATWYGAFDDGRLVATMGIVLAGRRVARLQEVQTHPEARGRGIGGSLVHAAGTDALRRLGASSLVTVADPEHHAIRIYRSVGFADTETQLQAIRGPR